MGEPQSRYDCYGEERNLALAGNRSYSLYPVVIPTELSQLIYNQILHVLISLATAVDEFIRRHCRNAPSYEDTGQLAITTSSEYFAFISTALWFESSVGNREIEICGLYTEKFQTLLVA
jgi:hypothetical protein